MDRLELEKRIRKGIPVTQQMGFCVLELDLLHIRVRGGGEENINVHGTAFAGSLYTLCTLAAWGLASSRLATEASLVMSQGEIRYRKPVVGEIQAYCDCQEAEMENFLRQLESVRKARLRLAAYVDVAGRHAVEFSATLHASL